MNERPFTPGDVGIGRELFLGTRPFANHGNSCSYCHTIGSIDRIGGARLGPDLTTVYTRFGGREGLGRWLASPPRGTMQALYESRPLTEDEIFCLVAFFDDARRRGPPASPAGPLKFFLIVCAGMLLALALLQAAWRRWRSRKTRRI